MSNPTPDGQAGNAESGSLSLSLSPSRTDQLAGVLTAPVTLAQRLLPPSPTPVALATGALALALAGLVEWPVAAALGLGYLALRGWRTPH